MRGPTSPLHLLRLIAAYSLDKLATIREHGLKGTSIVTRILPALMAVFSSSLVNGFDFVFMIIYFVYLGARTYGFHYRNADALSLGADWLAIGELARSSPWIDHRRCLDLSETSICDACEQLDGSQHPVYAHRVLLYAKLEVPRGRADK